MDVVKSTDQPATLSHVNSMGEAHMVDVTEKTETTRQASAQAVLQTTAEVIELITELGLPKGDVLAVARVAGIMAAKRTSDLIPLCHPLPLSGVEVRFDITTTRIRAVATVKTRGVTGVEMEALTAASVAALTMYDMIKAADKAATLTDTFVLEKTGGKSGHFVRESDD